MCYMVELHNKLVISLKSDEISRFFFKFYFKTTALSFLQFQHKTSITCIKNEKIKVIFKKMYIYHI